MTDTNYQTRTRWIAEVPLPAPFFDPTDRRVSDRGRR